MNATPDEGNQTVSGGGSATPSPSQTADQPLSGNLAAMEARLKATEGELKALKSGKDAAVNRVETAGKTLLEYARVLGVDEEKIKEAQRTMALDELVAQKYGAQPNQATGSGTVQTPVVEVTKIAAQYGLDANDASFIASLANETDADKVELAVARRAKEKQNQPSPTDAQRTAPAGGSGTQESTDLKAEYQKKVTKLRGNIKAVSDLQAEYRKKGLPN